MNSTMSSAEMVSSLLTISLLRFGGGGEGGAAAAARFSSALGELAREKRIPYLSD
jgi:hypothetical protein